MAVPPLGPAPRGGPLNRERVLVGAVDLVDRYGAAALTMRRLGVHLGVEAMSVYHYVGSKQELLDGMAEVLVRDLPVRYRRGSWEEALRLFAERIRQISLAHPAAFELVGMRPLASTVALSPVRALLQRLTAAGLSPAGAVAAYRVTVAYARGHSLAELAGLTLGRSNAPECWPADWEDVGPALLADPEVVFRGGLDLIVAGIRSAECGSDRS